MFNYLILFHSNLVQTTRHRLFLHYIPLLIVIFSGSLFVRFIRQKQRLRQTVTWRQCRMMLIQLSSISMAYMVMLFFRHISCVFRFVWFKNQTQSFMFLETKRTNR